MTALFLIAVVLLVLANGFFVAAEFALVKTRPSALDEMAKEGRRGAAMALRLREDLSQYLSACQLGITLASLGVGFLGEPLTAAIVAGLLAVLAGSWLATGSGPPPFLERLVTRGRRPELALDPWSDGNRSRASSRFAPSARRASS